MSIVATTWAARQRTDRPVDKLVLWAMADQPMPAGEFLCFASIATLVEFTGLDRKTVLASTARLSAPDRAGGPLIVDTGDRRGSTRQIIVWRLAVDQRTEPAAATSAAGETVPKTEPSQKRNSPVSSRKQSRKRDTDPERDPETPNGSAGEAEFVQRITGQRGARIEPDWHPSKELPDRLAKVVDGWPPGRMDELLEEFRDYWLAAAGKVASKMDWDRTWWNRIRAVAARDRERQNGRGNRRTGSKFRDPLRQLAADGGNPGMG